MRKLKRLSLPNQTANYLQKQQQKVQNASDPKAEANRLWDNLSDDHKKKVKQTLAKMASGRVRCMYCEDSKGTDIEHFWPKERYYAKAFSWENYLLACSHCNSNEKRTQFPTRKNKAGQEAPQLIDPTKDEPLEHLFLSPTTSRFQDVPQSLLGKKSIQVFNLNRADLIEGRADAWQSVEELLIKYDNQMLQGDKSGAAKTRRRLCRRPFSSAFVFLLDYSRRNEVTQRFLNPDCLAVLEARPGIYLWKF